MASTAAGWVVVSRVRERAHGTQVHCNCKRSQVYDGDKLHRAWQQQTSKQQQ
jgi:hypothetical protein